MCIRDRGTIFAGRSADTHERRARILHNRLDVVEVHVDQTRGRDQLSDALNARQEDLVGRAEGVKYGDIRVGDFQKTVVRDDDQSCLLYTSRCV